MKKKAELNNVFILIDYIRKFLKKSGFSESDIFDIVLASEEILVNISSYAYPEGAPGDIKVSCKFNKKSNKVAITFIDNGIEFNVLAVEKPNIDLPLEEREIGGFGIYFVKSLMDTISYKRVDNQNVLTVEKAAI